jgi:membrane protein EpsK
MAVPIGLVCGLAEPLLATWLGPNFVNLANLMSLLTVHLSINLAILPLFSVQLATGKVKGPAIVTVGLGVANVALVIALAGPVGWGLYGVAAGGVITLSLKNLLYTPLHVAGILRQPRLSFFSEVVPVVLITLGVTGIGKLVCAVWHFEGWGKLGAVSAAIGLLAAVAIRFWVVTPAEVAVIRDLVNGTLLRIRLGRGTASHS